MIASRSRLLIVRIMPTLLVFIAAQSAAHSVAHAGTAPAPTMAAASAVAPGAFSIAVIPDTQNEVLGADQRFANRTQWLVNNRSALNLAFVLHNGDMMNWDTADHAQYAIASPAMSKLHAASIPLIPAIGNHYTSAVCPCLSACPNQSAHDNLLWTVTFDA